MLVISLNDAKHKGLKLYYTGKPCRYGHVSLRYVYQAKCCECVRIRGKAYKEENLERNAALSKEWRVKNREKMRDIKKVWNATEKAKENQAIRSRRWYLLNKEKSLDAHYRWAEKNPAVTNAAAARYRASKTNQMPKWANHKEILAIYAEARALKMATGIDYHVDHIIPLQGKNVSGLHVETNLQILPGNENRSKSNRVPAEFCFDLA